MRSKAFLFYRLLYGGLLWVLLLGLPPGFTQDFPEEPPAATPAAEQPRQQTLAEDQTALERLRQELEALRTALPGRLEALQTGQLSETTVEQARVDADSARLRQEDLQADIANTRRRIQDLENAIQGLQTQEQLLQNPAKDPAEDALRAQQLTEVRRALVQRQADLELESRHLGSLRSRSALIEQRLALARQWQSRVEEVYRLQQEQSRREVQEDQISRLDRQLQGYRERAATLNQRLKQERATLTEAQRHQLEAEVQILEEQTRLVQTAIRLSEADTLLARAEDLANDPKAELEAVRKGLAELRDLKRELQTNRELSQRKVELFQQQLEVIGQHQDPTAAGRRLQNEEANLVSQLLDELRNRRQAVQERLDRVRAVRDRLSDHYDTLFSQNLLTRKTLPRTLEGWRELVAELTAAPGVLFHQVRLSLESAGKAMTEASALQWLGLLALEGALLALLAGSRRGLRRIGVRPGSQQEISFAGSLVRLLAELVRMNLAGIGLAAAWLLVLWVMAVPPPGQGILTTLVLLWIAIKIPIDLAWLLLAAPHVPPERYRPALYRHWVWVLLLGGLLAALTILAHLSALPAAASDIFDLLLMLYLLLTTVPVLRARHFLVHLLVGKEDLNRHWIFSLRLISLLLPIALLGIAVVGLVGYLHLAWLAGWHLMVFIAVLGGWLLLRGLLADLAVFLKNYAIAHSGYGLFWTQEVISPFHFTLRLLLLLGACSLLLIAYGWEVDEATAAAWRWLLLAVLGALVVYEAVYSLVGYFMTGGQSVFGSALLRHSRRPLGVIVPVAAAQLVAPTLAFSEDIIATLRQVLALVQIAAVAWLVVALVSVIDDTATRRYRVDVKDNIAARRVQTQIKMLRRIVLIVVYIVAISAMLMTFPKVRQLGAGLLASAGVAGLVVGVAARPLLENLIAGIQIGLTQPIRIDDAVVVEGEWGRIAEINATYVVVRLWDERRLIVPLNYFNTQTFQNWTHAGAELLGTVFLYVDYIFPVEEARQELKRILDACHLWDGRTWGLQVTNATDQSIELRALMSAPDASTAWDLRCHVREKLIEFVQKHYPDCLPRTRATLEREAGSGSPVSLTKQPVAQHN